MSTSINSLLSKIAGDCFIKHKSDERNRINKSIDFLIQNLEEEFGDDIDDIKIFGSFSRDTILPRRIDELSDVDVLIIFNHHKLGVKPDTYRKYLHDFADDYYPNSTFYKDRPSVVLELQRIKYDLVPAYESSGMLSSDSLYIPTDGNDWMSTDPHRFSEELTEKNSNNKSFIKPLIRLLKAWNAKSSYPVASFDLEQRVVSTTFWDDSLESGFFRVINNLDSYRDSSFTSEKIRSLQANAVRVKDALDDDNLSTAEKWLEHILPLDKI